jgi:hypothetical protein
MAWSVELKESVLDDLRWFGKSNTMKLIPLSEAKAHLSQYGRLCHDEPVTVNGVPSFQLVPLEEDDDLIGRLLEHHPSFRKMLEARLRERSVTAREALKRL